MLSLSPKKPLSVILEATAGLVSPPASSPDSQTPGYNLVCIDTGALEESVQDSSGNYLSKVKNSLKTKAERERERKKRLIKMLTVTIWIMGLWTICLFLCFCGFENSVN